MTFDEAIQAMDDGKTLFFNEMRLFSLQDGFYKLEYVYDSYFIRSRMLKFELLSTNFEEWTLL